MQSKIIKLIAIQINLIKIEINLRPHRKGVGGSCPFYVSI